MKNVVIAGYARSPFHFAKKGALARVRPDELAAQVVAALVERSKIDPKEIEDVIMGCAIPEGEQGLNIGRIVAFLAHLPLDVGEAFICAGIESMTRVPMTGFNPSPHPGLAKEYPHVYISMAQTAENVARKYQVTREQQQEFAVKSHKKAAAAQAAGKLEDEIVAIKAKEGMVDQDGCIRPDTTQETLSGLPPAFDAEGTVTAGTASPLTDGAAAVLVTTEDYAKRNNLPILARLKSFAVAGCAPELMGIGPVPAAQKALKRAGLAIKDIDIVEINEAFASQAIACMRELGIDEGKANLDGGAIALGHPLGATGARLTGKAAALLKREGKRYALATQCIGGGLGIATLRESA